MIPLFNFGAGLTWEKMLLATQCNPNDNSTASQNAFKRYLENALAWLTLGFDPRIKMYTAHYNTSGTLVSPLTQ